MHPKKRTVGVRIPDHVFVQALLDALGEPLLTSTLILPGETEPRTMGWEIKEELDHVVDIVVEAGECPAEPTTVIDWSEGYPESSCAAARATRTASRTDPSSQRVRALVTRSG
jgi:tRNA A37 threonylcarbamoyladenosine synthetase subunit TsaC/SUA5/YrdC